MLHPQNFWWHQKDALIVCRSDSGFRAINRYSGKSSPRLHDAGEICGTDLQPTRDKLLTSGDSESYRLDCGERIEALKDFGFRKPNIGRRTAFLFWDAKFALCFPFCRL
jgi:hypothetical protein